MNPEFGMLLGTQDDDSIEINLDFNNESYQDKLLENNLIWEIDRIALEYFSEDKLSDETIDKLKNDYEFRFNLLKNIENRMHNILINNSSFLYKKLITIINLLSNGEKYNIFENYNEYSISKYQKSLHNIKIYLLNNHHL